MNAGTACHYPEDFWKNAMGKLSTTKARPWKNTCSSARPVRNVSQSWMNFSALPAPRWRRFKLRRVGLCACPCRTRPGSLHGRRALILILPAVRKPDPPKQTLDRVVSEQWAQTAFPP